MNNYLASVRTNNAWSEESVIGTIRGILDHYIGRPPEHVKVGGNEMTPREYLEKVVRLNLDDYVEFMSLMEKPYYEKVEYEVPDNWWHSKEYYNVPLDEFMAIIRRAVRSGHSVCIGGDTSEPGIDGHAGIAVVPTFDIPAAYIDENARQFRFSNKTTGDDHGIHIVGYLEKDGKDWYLIKDSGSGSRNNLHAGYYFYQEDYVKLKMLGITVPKEVAQDILKKFK
jgi:bleomycin hydrolase